MQLLPRTSCGRCMLPHATYLGYICSQRNPVHGTGPLLPHCDCAPSHAGCTMAPRSQHAADATPSLSRVHSHPSCCPTTQRTLQPPCLAQPPPPIKRALAAGGVATVAALWPKFHSEESPPDCSPNDTEYWEGATLAVGFAKRHWRPRALQRLVTAVQHHYKCKASCEAHSMQSLNQYSGGSTIPQKKARMRRCLQSSLLIVTAPAVPLRSTAARASKWASAAKALELTRLLVAAVEFPAELFILQLVQQGACNCCWTQWAAPSM
jgi:hypothetical protein